MAIIRSEEWKRKRSEYLKKMWRNPEYRAKFEGKNLSNEHKRKISDALKEYCKNPEVKKRKSQELKKQWEIPELSAKRARKVGFKVSENTKRKLSKINLIIWSDKERLKQRTAKRIGNKLTKEQRKILSESHIGLSNNWLGRKHSQEAKYKMRIATTKNWEDPEFRNNMTGENHPCWQGGKSFEPYPVTFNKQRKEIVRVRDNFTCQLCGVPELECNRRLSIHHIDYVKSNCDTSNLISLCVSCNSKVNKNRSEWTMYLKNKVIYYTVVEVP